MNVNYPNQLLRTWDQYSLNVAQQVTIYRLTNPVTATAAAAKTQDTLKPSGEFCFGCNQPHDPTKCAIVAAIVAAHPQYRRVIQAKRTDPMRIPQDGYTLLVPPGFALVFNNTQKKTDNHARPRSDQRGRGGRGGRGRGRTALAAAAIYDTAADTYIDDYDRESPPTESNA